MVFALDHQYTQRGLSLELLKGADRQTAKLVVAAAKRLHVLDATDGSLLESVATADAAPPQGKPR